MNSVSEIGLSTCSIPNSHLRDLEGKDIDANMSLNECGSKIAIASVSDDVMPSESDDVINDESDDAVFCSVDAWMAQWQMLAVHRPILVQVLLYIFDAPSRSCIFMYFHRPSVYLFTNHLFFPSSC